MLKKSIQKHSHLSFEAHLFTCRQQVCHRQQLERAIMINFERIGISTQMNITVSICTAIENRGNELPINTEFKY